MKFPSTAIFSLNFYKSPCGLLLHRAFSWRLILACALGLILQVPVVHAGSWSAAGSSQYAHGSGSTATLLANGKVLVVGGYIPGAYYMTSAELYDPATGTWSTTGDLKTGRSQHTATLLANGKVLVAGGYTAIGYTSSAELYDPTSGTWTNTGDIGAHRGRHTATLLANGNVLLAGGFGDANGTAMYSATLYNPVNGLWSATGDFTSTVFNARGDHTATLLANGKVLIAGGFNGVNYLPSAQLYDPSTGTWSTGGSLLTARSLHTATLLANGKVLVAGGNNGGILKSAELYDPTTGSWSATGNLSTARYQNTVVLLANGKVLVIGGSGVSTNLSSSELYDTSTGTWSAAGNLNTARAYHTSALLNSGKVLAAGGNTFSGGNLVTSELGDFSTSQTITFGALASKTYGDAPFTVSATANSGLSPTFSIVSGPATISGNTVTITGAGSVVVRASQAGDSIYAAATPVDQSFTVNTALQSWRQTYFGTTANTGTAADSAVSNLDGLPNLLEYALGGTPTVANSAIPPKLGTVTNGGATYLTLTFTPQRSDITYAIEASGNLTGAWTSIPLAGLLTMGQPYTYTDTVAVAAGAPRFIRLRVSGQ